MPCKLLALKGEAGTGPPINLPLSLFNVVVFIIKQHHCVADLVVMDTNSLKKNEIGLAK